MKLQYDILLIGFAMAFCITTVMHIRFKPFNCLPCMSGWCSLAVAWAYYGEVSNWQVHGVGIILLVLAYFPLGYLIGAIFEAIKMRWL